jgi:CRP-like cAMP-binding protein
MTIVALEDSEALELSRGELDELRVNHLVVSDTLLAIAGIELRRVSELLVEMMFVDADRRVRRRLLELGAQYRDEETGLTVITLTQEEIAQLAGTSRMTVSRVLAQEQARGTVLKRRRTMRWSMLRACPGRLGGRTTASQPRSAERNELCIPNVTVVTDRELCFV